MNSEGIERDQWNKMGKKNYFKCCGFAETAYYFIKNWFHAKFVCPYITFL